MKRLTGPLVLIGVALIGVALWLYNSAADDRAMSESICRLGGGDCDVTMSWGPTIIAAVCAAAVLGAAWKLGRSPEGERTEQLVD